MQGNSPLRKERTTIGWGRETQQPRIDIRARSCATVNVSRMVSQEPHVVSRWHLSYWSLSPGARGYAALFFALSKCFTPGLVKPTLHSFPSARLMKPLGKPLPGWISWLRARRPSRRSYAQLKSRRGTEESSPSYSHQPGPPGYFSSPSYAPNEPRKEPEERAGLA